MPEASDRKAHLADMIKHVDERAANFRQMLEYTVGHEITPILLDRLAESCGDLAGSVSILANRAGDYAAELLDGED